LTKILTSKTRARLVVRQRGGAVREFVDTPQTGHLIHHLVHVGSKE
jgi:hypothetical protein